jgi:hypothetical protein
LGNRGETIWKLALEQIAFCGSVSVLSVYGPSIESIYVKSHSISAVQPFKEVEVCHGLGFRGSFVGVVYPRKVFRFGRGVFVCSTLWELFLCLKVKSATEGKSEKESFVHSLVLLHSMFFYKVMLFFSYIPFWSAFFDFHYEKKALLSFWDITK